MHRRQQSWLYGRNGGASSMRLWRELPCGVQIWIVGSAQTGLGCFRCVTGQPEPDHDYEINVADEYTVN